MIPEYSELMCYKQIEIDSHGKLKFFLEKHSTKEGTWGKLSLQEGIIDFVFLNGQGHECSRARIDSEHPQLLIPLRHGIKLFQSVKRLKQSLSFIACPSDISIKNTV